MVFTSQSLKTTLERKSDLPFASNSLSKLTTNLISLADTELSNSSCHFFFFFFVLACSSHESRRTSETVFTSSEGLKELGSGVEDIFYLPLSHTIPNSLQALLQSTPANHRSSPYSHTISNYSNLWERLLLQHWSYNRSVDTLA